jgi:hypothetical protein
MNISQIISELRSQRNNLDDAILSLERLALSVAKKRGRPPKRVAEAGVARFIEMGANGTPRRSAKPLPIGIGSGRSSA